MERNEQDLLKKQGLDTNSMKLKLLSIKGMMNLVYESIEERLELLEVVDDFDTEIPLATEIVETIDKIVKTECDTAIIRLSTLYTQEKKATFNLKICCQ